MQSLEWTVGSLRATVVPVVLVMMNEPSGNKMASVNDEIKDKFVYQNTRGARPIQLSS